MTTMMSGWLLKAAFWLPLLFCTWMALAPQPPKIPGLDLADTVLHALAFSYLAFALMLAYADRSALQAFVALLGYGIFIELVDKLMLPGSHVKGAENIAQALCLIEQKKSVLFLMKHAGNFDVPCFYSLLSKEGEQYQRVLDRLVFIAQLASPASGHFTRETPALPGIL